MQEASSLTLVSGTFFRGGISTSCIDSNSCRQLQAKEGMLSAGPEVIKLFSCSTQLSMDFKLLINTEIANLMEISVFNHQSQSFILINVKMLAIVGNFNIYEQDKFHVQLSFITSEPGQLPLC